MHYAVVRFTWPLLLAGCVILSGCNRDPSARHHSAGAPLSGLSSEPPGQGTLGKELRAITNAYADINPSTGVQRDSLFDRALDEAAYALLQESIPENEPVLLIEAMNRRIFGIWGISFGDDRNNVRYLLPNLVWKEKKGSCVGMSLLYLLLAEKAGIPLHAVRAPSHLFVRYDNGRDRLNIETLRRGECMSDSWYRRRYAIVDTALYPLRNLSLTETAAIVVYNLGTMLLYEKKYGSSIRYLREAVAAFPDFPEAKGNLALAYEAKGEVHRALSLLLEIQSAYPSLEGIDRTVASLQLRRGEYRRALGSFDAACRADTFDPDAQYGRAVVLARFKRFDEACTALNRAVTLQPGYAEALILKKKIDCPATTYK